MADITAAPGASIELSIDWGATGKTLGARILDNAGATTTARFTGFSEYPASSGVYYKQAVTVPSVGGQYTILFDDDGGTAAVGHVATIDLLITSSLAGGGSPGGRDLCTLADVTALVPGYETDAETDAILQALITSESRDAHRRLGREVVAIDPAVDTRRFDLSRWEERNRRIRIQDATSITSVTVIDYDQTTELETVAAADRVSLPRVREEWEPITQLSFPSGTANPATIRAGLVLEVEATWGWPSVPEDLKMAVATMVLVRYLGDAAQAGTAFADALGDVGFNPGRAFVSAQEKIKGYARRPAVA